MLIMFRGHFIVIYKHMFRVRPMKMVPIHVHVLNVHGCLASLMQPVLSKLCLQALLRNWAQVIVCTRNPALVTLFLVKPKSLKDKRKNDTDEIFFLKTINFTIVLSVSIQKM